MRIGVFGGTFDPIHNGHILIAEYAREELALEKVVFMPAGLPWFKKNTEVTPAVQRLEMVKLAISDRPYFDACDLEVKGDGPTYTANTLSAMGKTMGGQHQIYLILGMDALHEIEKWHAPGRVFELATVVGMSRPNTRDIDIHRLNSMIPEAVNKILLIKGPHIEISASEVRNRISSGLSITCSIPELVESYIYEHGLYKARSGNQRKDVE